VTEAGDVARRRTVLVVDDEVEICRMVERVLKRDHDVTTLTDPVEALERIRAGARFDLIISDVMMPRLTGVALLGQIAELDGAQAARLVFLTASVLPVDFESTFRSLPNTVLRKPISIHSLRDFVRDRLLEP